MDAELYGVQPPGARRRRVERLRQASRAASSDLTDAAVRGSCGPGFAASQGSVTHRSKEFMTMANVKADVLDWLSRARPLLHQNAPEIQPFGQLVRLPLALEEKVCLESIDNLNQVLADTITLRDMYKKHHWQVIGPTFYQLHLLFDKHFEEQSKIVDLLAERVQLLGGVSVAMAPDVAERTLIPRVPRGREAAPVQISRLLHAHEIILREARTMSRLAADHGDDGTNDLLVSTVIRTNELQVWFVAEHVADVPVVDIPAIEP
jgi:starvation-inducible DNA-binding protein